MNHNLVQNRRENGSAPGADIDMALGELSRPMFARILVQSAPCPSPARPGASSSPALAWGGEAPVPSRPVPCLVVGAGSRRGLSWPWSVWPDLGRSGLALGSDRSCPELVEGPVLSPAWPLPWAGGSGSWLIRSGPDRSCPLPGHFLRGWLTWLGLGSVLSCPCLGLGLVGGVGVLAKQGLCSLLDWMPRWDSYPAKSPFLGAQWVEKHVRLQYWSCLWETEFLHW